MSNISLFPERLKELMFDSGQKTIREFAEKLGVHPTSVGHWLNGTTVITLENAVKLADFFGCSIDYLAGMSEVDRKVTPRPLPPFYENLRKVMAECGVTRYRLSKDVVADVFFTKWAHGVEPLLCTVCKIAQYLNVSVDYLIGRTDY